MHFSAAGMMQRWNERVHQRARDTNSVPDFSAPLPDYMRSAAAHYVREDQANEPKLYDFAAASRLLAVQRDLTDRAVGYFERRTAERAVAAYIENRVIPTPEGSLDQRLPGLVQAMRACRCYGTYGVTEEGKPVVFWAEKCGSALLCPDESREEQQRVINRYLPALLAEKKAGNRIYKAVFTFPNFPPGKLRCGMQTMFRRVRALLRARRNGQALFPEIKGMLVILEAPLSSRGDWNVHLNVILVCDRWLDYDKLKRFWHWQIEITDESRMRAITARRLAEAGQPLGDLSAELVLRKALTEIIKYPIQTIATKADGAGTWDSSGQFVSAAGVNVAPAMVEWPPVAWLEWYKAHQRTRRTRSYGCLYALPLVEHDKLDMSTVTIIGTIKLGPRRYELSIPWLGLIRMGDKFTSDDGKTRQRAGPKPEFTPLEVSIFMDDCRRAFEKHHGSTL